MWANIHGDGLSIKCQPTVDRQSTECRSSINQVSADIAVDITYGKHDPYWLQSCVQGKREMWIESVLDIQISISSELCSMLYKSLSNIKILLMSIVG